MSHRRPDAPPKGELSAKRTEGVHAPGLAAETPSGAPRHLPLWGRILSTALF